MQKPPRRKRRKNGWWLTPADKGVLERRILEGSFSRVPPYPGEVPPENYSRRISRSDPKDVGSSAGRVGGNAGGEGTVGDEVGARDVSTPASVDIAAVQSDPVCGDPDFRNMSDIFLKSGSPQTGCGESPPQSSRVTRTDTAIIDELLERYAAVPGLVNLAPGAPSCAPTTAVLKAASEAALCDQSLSRYNDVLGWDLLRSRWLDSIVADWDPRGLADQAEAFGVSRDDDYGLELMVTAGANQGFVNVVLSICDHGDEVILMLPYYFSHLNALTVTGVKPVLVPCDRTTFLPRSIRDVAEMVSPLTKAIVLVSPGNPSGVTAPSKFVSELLTLCKSANLWLILDEAYKEITYDGVARTSCAALSNVIRLYTMSKVYGMAGWRVGALLYPKELSLSLRKVQDTIPTHATMISQIAAYHALGDGGNVVATRVSNFAGVRQTFISNLREVYDVCHGDIRHKLHVNSNLGDQSFVPGDGAFYLFLPVGNGKKDAVDALVRSVNILTVPGAAFGMPGYIRVSYGSVAPSDAAVVAASLAAGLRRVLHVSAPQQD